jgi:hypothetical protein
MNPALVIAFVNLAIDTIERFGPELKRMVAAGEISAEEQQKLLDRINALRQGGTAFDGPEWQVN